MVYSSDLKGELLCPFDIPEARYSVLTEEDKYNEATYLIDTHKGLIDSYLNSFSHVSNKVELQRHGQIALASAAMDFDYKENFSDYALMRIKQHIDKAMEEERDVLTVKITKKTMQKETILKVFRKIQDRFS